MCPFHCLFLRYCVRGLLNEDNYGLGTTMFPLSQRINNIVLSFVTISLLHNFPNAPYLLRECHCGRRSTQCRDCRQELETLTDLTIENGTIVVDQSRRFDGHLTCYASSATRIVSFFIQDMLRVS